MDRKPIIRTCSCTRIMSVGKETYVCMYVCMYVYIYIYILYNVNLQNYVAGGSTMSNNDMFESKTVFKDYDYSHWLNMIMFTIIYWLP